MTATTTTTAAERFGPLRLADLCTGNAAMERCLKLAALAAESDVPVLILGETGTGKTLMAQAIHNSSRRAQGRFISFNASAMSDTLLESQLFGHERGAFTGAQRELKGKFELANDGTLFFDEIADMSLLAQAKILRAVEYGEFERLGSERMLRSNARIVSATNLSLRDRIRENRFREDLYHRLAGLTLRIPALRDRPEDLPGLIASELDAAARSVGKRLETIHPEALERLLGYAWPGNLRELHHTMRTVALFCPGTEVLPDHVLFQPDLHAHEALSPPSPALLAPAAASPADITPPAQPPTSTPTSPSAAPVSVDDPRLSTAVARHVLAVYEQAGRNQRRTARLLAISRAKLARHLQASAPPIS